MVTVNQWLKAAEDGDVALVRKAVDSSDIKDVNVKNKTGETAVMLATAAGKIDVVQYLAEKGADLAAKDNNGCTALILAATGSKNDIAAYLINRKVDVNARNRFKYSALYFASFNGNLDLCRILLAAGASVTDTDINQACECEADKTQLTSIRTLLRSAKDATVPPTSPASPPSSPFELSKYRAEITEKDEEITRLKGLLESHKQSIHEAEEQERGLRLLHAKEKLEWEAQAKALRESHENEKRALEEKIHNLQNEKDKAVNDCQALAAEKNALQQAREEALRTQTSQPQAAASSGSCCVIS